MRVFLRSYLLCKYMEEKVQRALALPKIYLEYVGFALEDRARFQSRLIIDMGVAFIYSFVSIFLIWKQNTTLVVLILNVLCLTRSMIGNTISASEITLRAHKTDIEAKLERNSHFHKKSIALAVAWVFLLTFIISSFIDQIVFSSPVKAYASLTLIIVLLDDWERDFVNMYNAVIKLEEK